jgi:hypothetical protein
MSKMIAHTASRVTGETFDHDMVVLASLGRRFAGLCLDLEIDLILTGVRRVQFALLGRTADLTAVPSGSIGSAHPLG